VDAGFTAEELVLAGLAVWRQEDRPKEGHYDRFRGRVMFSICNDVGEVVGFSGRVLEEGAKTAKYVNSPETPLFRKGRLLFGLHLTKRPIIEADCAILCEGQVDLIRMYESGIKNVVAPQGTAFTPDQARAVKRLANRVVLLFDADGAGKKAAEAAFRLLAAQNASVHAATLPQGEDPDSFLRAHGSAELVEMIGAAPDFFERELEESATRFPVRTAQGKMKAAEHLAALLAAVEEPILLDAFLQKAASRLAVPADEIRRLRTRAAKTAAVRGGGTAGSRSPRPAAPRRSGGSLRP
jgi:DNA primase